MKPYPFVGLNHFTVPIVMDFPSKTHCHRSEVSGGSSFCTVRGAGPVLDQELGRAAEPREVDGKQISSPPLACNSQHHHRSAERRPTNHITSAKGVVGKSAASRLCTLRDAPSGRPQHEVLLESGRDIDGILRVLCSSFGRNDAARAARCIAPYPIDATLSEGAASYRRSSSSHRRSRFYPLVVRDAAAIRETALCNAG